ncbi:MAG: methionyl-tRNA formyltransferase, partial [Clostridia bacterium]|nr:methionyl-tRNA formyltransferase [Clostridia bacterium]
LQPDVCVTAAFGQILSQEVLDIPKMGTVNVHASLLPEYRGSSPINWCLLNGEKVTGVTTMLTDKGIDTGDILQKAECVIEEEDTTATLTVKLAELGAGLLIDTLKKLENGTCPREKQDESKMSYYPMLKKEMGLLDFNKTAQQLVDQVRAFDPWPCAYLMVDGAPMKVWKAAVEDQTGIPGQILCANAKEGLVIAAGEKALKVVELQAQGGKRMRAQDYLRGHALEQTNID